MLNISNTLTLALFAMCFENLATNAYWPSRIKRCYNIVMAERFSVKSGNYSTFFRFLYEIYSFHKDFLQNFAPKMPFYGCQRSSIRLHFTL